jgi:hypothetical protein
LNCTGLLSNKGTAIMAAPLTSNRNSFTNIRAAVVKCYTETEGSLVNLVMKHSFILCAVTAGGWYTAIALPTILVPATFLNDNLVVASDELQSRFDLALGMLGGHHGQCCASNYDGEVEFECKANTIWVSYLCAYKCSTTTSPQLQVPAGPRSLSILALISLTSAFASSTSTPS